MNLGSSIDDRVKPDARGLRSKIRLNAWILGALVIFFYLGYFAWNLLRGFISSGVH